MREPGTARIAVDLLGGDHAPAVVVDGALRACQADPALHLLLVGPAEAADAVVAALDPDQRARVVTLGSDEGVRAAVRAVAEGRADAALSAGNTADTVTSAALHLGRWPGVRRPPLTAVLPSAAGRLVLLDVGSSVDPDKQTLAVHARLGAAYAAVVHEVPAPRVGLLTIGTESGKGDRLRRAVPPLLAGLDLPAGASYVGLVEGHDVVTGAVADVVVTDGFTGNVLLKGLETAYAALGSPDRTSTGVPPRAALLLGVAGTVVVCHGAASGPDVAAGIDLAARLHRRAAVPAMAALTTANEVFDER
ncbi:phosphate acyltransferase PlsX [Paractinoplanes rishiriensis]|uniref:phosphate acyltransferase PlsX n=1 Tax=Paractinoplanes rishiriensis TaxID=1050105 RepID=UPI001EF1701F|nr:phosphate acyltransferase PlsX [Actinoplanes rishiriensis]